MRHITTLLFIARHLWLALRIRWLDFRIRRLVRRIDRRDRRSSALIDRYRTLRLRHRELTGWRGTGKARGKLERRKTR